MRIQLDINAVGAFQWEIARWGKGGNEMGCGPPAQFGRYRWNLAANAKVPGDGADSYMSAFLETPGAKGQLGDDASIRRDFGPRPPTNLPSPEV